MDKLTLPPNTIDYNLVLNAWSRALRYNADAALRAEDILLRCMEAPLSSSSALALFLGATGDNDPHISDTGQGDGGGRWQR
jgi:hypothetical protein